MPIDSIFQFEKNLSPILFRHVCATNVIPVENIYESITDYVTETSAPITSVVDEVIDNVEHEN